MKDTKRDKKEFRLAFMLANWYSGATLFAILLNNHNQITCNGEAFPFRPEERELYICSCGKPLRDCEYYKAAGSHMLEDNKKSWNKEFFIYFPQFSKNIIINKWLTSFRYMHRLRDITISLVPGYREKVRRFLGSHQQFFLKGCELENSKVYVDGTKSVRRAEVFANYSDLPFKIIHLVRDGRAFCCSWIQNNELPKEKLPEAARYWLEYEEIIDMLSSRHPEIPLMTLRYEDLCENPKQTLSAVCEFLEVPFDNAMVKPTNKPYHVLGHKMRKSFNGEIKENVSWRSKLTSEEIDTISSIMEKTLTRFGYL